MKLIYILPTLQSGGAELRGIERINFLSELPGFSVKLIVLSYQINLIKNVNEKVTVEVLHLKNASVLSQKAFLASISNANVLRKSIKSFNPDVVIASLPVSHHLVRLALLPLKRKIKVIQYHHATQYLENPINKISHRLFHQITRFLSNKVDFGHVFISEAVKNDISAHLNITNGHVLYNALPDKYDEVLQIQSHINTSDFNIVIPGRLTSVKGHLPALETIKKMLAEHPSIKVWIIGEGNERKKIQNFIDKHNFQNQIFIVGETPHSILLRYLYDSDVVLIPSLSEGLGNVAIEALMMGATVVSSNVGGLKEVINNPEVSYLYNIKQPQELLNFVERIYNKQLTLSKEKIRNSYLERFTIEQHIENFIKIISEK